MIPVIPLRRPSTKLSTHPGRGARHRGFTLIELAVVIAILVFLISGLGAVCAGMRGSSRVESTRSLIRALDSACDSYRSKLGSYPGFPRATSDTTVLHRALCVPLPASGTNRLIGPFIELPSSRLSCAPQIHDDWGWPIRYSLPGALHGRGADNSRRFDLDATSTEGGVIGNWPEAR
ncbi:MAG: prepilin-type N-terminal cleavage/methylation domain-containing protein [Planctomycetota bacterium]